MLDKNDFILVATLKDAHGLDGGLHLHIYTHNPQSLQQYETLYDKNGAVFVISRLKIKGKSAVIHFKNITDRTQAERLKNVELFVPRNQLPHLDEDEFYYVDLIGCKVFDENQKEWGVVHAVYDFGAGPILELICPNGKKEMIPFQKQTVPHIDLEHNSITIQPNQCGLNDPKE